MCIILHHLTEVENAVVDAQNEVTQEVLASCETRGKFKELMTKLYNYPRYGCPFKRGGRCGVSWMRHCECGLLDAAKLRSHE